MSDEKREKSRLAQADQGASVFHEGHIKMTPADAEIFQKAAEIYKHPLLSQAIDEAGGHLGHKYFFSEVYCENKPITPWCEKHDEEHVLSALENMVEELQLGTMPV